MTGLSNFIQILVNIVEVWCFVASHVEPPVADPYPLVEHCLVGAQEGPVLVVWSAPMPSLTLRLQVGIIAWDLVVANEAQVARNAAKSWEW